jgi:Zn-dependent protease with chaperone function
VLLGALVLVAVAPLLFFLLCPHRASCLRAAGSLNLWLVGAAKVGLAMAVMSLVAWAARLAWLLRLDARLVSALPESRTPPAELQAALSRAGPQRAHCVVSEQPIAFCTGALLPVIVVSDSLVRRLRPAELRAVLIHELDHASHREPHHRAPAGDPGSAG